MSHSGNRAEKKFLFFILTSCFLLLASSLAYAQPKLPTDAGAEEKAFRLMPFLNVPEKPLAPEVGYSKEVIEPEDIRMFLVRRFLKDEKGKTISYLVLKGNKAYEMSRSREETIKFTAVGKNVLFAQQVPTDVGAEERAFRERKIEEVSKPAKKRIAVEEEEEELLPEGVPFLVKKIRVVGNKTISSKEIEGILRPYEGKELTLNELRKATRQITRLYQSKGYLTSRAFIPAQEVIEGEVTLEVIEAKLGQIQIEKTKRIPAKWIERRIRLKPGKILQVRTLERDLVRMNRNPDVETRAVLVKGAKPETTDLVISVKEKFPIHAGYTFDNQGTKFTGRMRHGVDLAANGIFNLNDRLVTRTFISDTHEFVGVVAAYSTPINELGTSAQMTFSNVNLELGRGLNDSEVLGRATVFSPAITQAIVESDKLEANLTAGFDFKRIRTRVNAGENSNDVLRVLRVGPNLTQWDRWGRSILASSFGFGFPTFLGASDKKDKNASRIQTGGQFFQVLLDGARVQNLWKSLVLFLRGGAQFSPDRLVTAEQFRIGGMNTVRGYAEGEFLGDYGFSGTAELRIPPYLFPNIIRLFGKEINMKESFQFVLFTDVAKAYLSKPLAQEDSSRLLVGVGGGILIDLFHHVAARVMLGAPVGDRSVEENNPRLHFVLTATW